MADEAGRLMSRSAAKASITLTPFEKAMEEIAANIGDAVEIVKTIKPFYNFKAAE